ncbi:nitrite reductase small subunit NirD [Massilia glaciei]|uniref:Nitrite reductase (NAD(P)H) small subunit n=1 Tax=Massilia glaciei TaxID=1524097 RepID=A0A2U2I7G9_9BURK|nr:nitrite reductase small subunit NirD [Massilia glaciei]PWF55691.1 nitrite reductase (NAD(P)H) small subunit [Massilia glaciei]
MSEQWKVICKVTDIPVLGARVVKRGLAWQELPNVAVFRNAEDKVFALLDRCPHKGGPLSQGIVFGEKVACPLHNWNIELASGCATAPDVGCAKSFKVRVEDGNVSLDLDELSAPASRAEAALAGSFQVATHIEAA